MVLCCGISSSGLDCGVSVSELDLEALGINLNAVPPGYHVKGSLHQHKLGPTSGCSDRLTGSPGSFQSLGVQHLLHRGEKDGGLGWGVEQLNWDGDNDRD